MVIVLVVGCGGSLVAVGCGATGDFSSRTGFPACRATVAPFAGCASVQTGSSLDPYKSKSHKLLFRGSVRVVVGVAVRSGREVMGWQDTVAA